jgi:hypothetical protein
MVGMDLATMIGVVVIAVLLVCCIMLLMSPL